MEDIYFHVMRGNDEVMVAPAVFRKGSSEQDFALVPFAEFTAQTTGEASAYIKGGIDVFWYSTARLKEVASDAYHEGVEDEHARWHERESVPQ